MYNYYKKGLENDNQNVSGTYLNAKINKCTIIAQHLLTMSKCQNYNILIKNIYILKYQRQTR